MQSIDLIHEELRDVAADYGSHFFTLGGQYFARVEQTTREYGFPRRNAFTQPRFEQTIGDCPRRVENATVLCSPTVNSGMPDLLKQIGL